VLVAEDNVVNQQLAVRLLERRGLVADVVENGREALAAIEAGDYALVLMDCQMPVMDGYEAVFELRRREAGGRRVPVIAVTAHSLEGDRDKCIAAGMDDYLSKPLDATAFDQVLTRWLPGGDEARDANGNADDGGRLSSEGSIQSGGQSAATYGASPREASAVEASALHGAVDAQALARLGDEVGGPEVLRSIVEVFLRNAPEQAAAVAEAVRRGDAEAIGRAAHKLKGGAATVGAVAVAAASRALMEAGRSGDVAYAEELLPALDRAMVLTPEALESELADI
jgi:CheY-like chemotaxis protein